MIFKFTCCSTDNPNGGVDFGYEVMTSNPPDLSDKSDLERFQAELQKACEAAVGGHPYQSATNPADVIVAWCKNFDVSAAHPVDEEGGTVVLVKMIHDLDAKTFMEYLEKVLDSEATTAEFQTAMRETLDQLDVGGS